MDKLNSHAFEKKSDFTNKTLCKTKDCIKQKQTNTIKHLVDGLQVPTQYDYRNIAERQCSWFCAEIIKNLHQFIKYIEMNDIQMIKSLYTSCLITASKNKHNSPDYANIETLFHQNILDVIGNKISKKFTNMIFNKTNFSKEYDQIMQMSFPNYTDVVTQKMSFQTITVENLKYILENMSETDVLAINRSMKSFIVYNHKNIFIVFDSHEKTIKVYTNSVDIIKYVNNTVEYNLVTILYAITDHRTVNCQ
jgi:hypothetical protein